MTNYSIYGFPDDENTNNSERFLNNQDNIYSSHEK